MLIYISHPFGNKPENMKKVEEIIHNLIKENPQHTYISPIHCFSFAYTGYPYEQGMDMCLKLLDVCDEMWVFGDHENSRGCTEEIMYCVDMGKDFMIK